MFIIKILINDQVIDRKALFMQAKFDFNFSIFQIEKHQLQFYSQIDNIIFKFGNLVYKKYGVSLILWQNISKPDNFGDYILIGDRKVIDLPMNLIKMQYKPIGDKYPFDIRRMAYYINGVFPPCNHIIISPLHNFLLPFGKGSRIEGNFQQFIELIFKKLKLNIDPLEENDGFWEEDKRGFGIVEITYDEKNL